MTIPPLGNIDRKTSVIIIHQGKIIFHHHTHTHTYINNVKGLIALQHGAMVSKLVALNQLQLSSEFDHHWVLHTFGILLHLSGKTIMPQGLSQSMCLMYSL